MELWKNDWVWVGLTKKGYLAMVVVVREHSVLVQVLNKGTNRFSPYRETVSRRVIKKVELTKEERDALPCGKRPLSLGKAKMIVATNHIFKDDPARHERRVYYCRRCRAFHTTGQFKLPMEFLKRLAENPYTPEEMAEYWRKACRKKVWRWWHTVLGIRVSFGRFEGSLKNYGDNRADAIKKMLVDPLNYLHHLYQYLYDNRKRPE
ncbi:hypothetical protein FAZ15_01580 [Sphingobacterium olei]|uniref:Uncharacterized protein n=1 Tax=Sphingobacterium olei TaxID=2571155 RepID=A0A4U0P6F3_9SPHI|nr:hypothetical protein [Sphingobacterium olei]TJZ63015.1 hypothetical protein FAZ15_01580 [Sphingobacterium olei]